MRNFELTLNPNALQRLQDTLELKAPVVVIINEFRSGRRLGMMNPTDVERPVTIDLNQSLYQRSPLSYVIKTLRKTILHEYRHWYQTDHWPKEKWDAEASTPYVLKPSEIDACDWAESHEPDFRDLFDLKVSNVGNSHLPG